MQTFLLQVWMLATYASAACECGYSLNQTTDAKYAVFTEKIETNFLTTSNITADGNWTVVEHNYTVASGSQYNGRAAEARNVVANPSDSTSSSSNLTGINGGVAGMQLYVRSGEPVDKLISSSEVRSTRSDIMYGSFRAQMRLTPIAGTCGAFFFYYNDTQEIDIEIFSREFTSSSGNISMTLQTAEEQASLGEYTSGDTPNHHVAMVDFDPSAAFHEYRFDWLPNRCSFYVDGVWHVDLATDAIPTMPGEIIFNHWSTGNPKTSAGPPEEDAIMEVAWTGLYFNSSDDTVQSEFKTKCKRAGGIGSSTTCEIESSDAVKEGTNTSSNSSATPRTNIASGLGLAVLTGWIRYYLV